jgi:hypothetical protein
MSSSKPVKRKAAVAPSPEPFIGHEATTMAGSETYADLERRERAAQGKTAPVPRHSAAEKPGPPVPTAGDAADSTGLIAAHQPDEDFLPDEVGEEDEEG